jgi:gentisate 1,2-dioxygenase
MAALTTRDATLAAIEHAERRVFVLENPRLGGFAVRALGLFQEDTERRT